MGRCAAALERTVRVGMPVGDHSPPADPGHRVAPVHRSGPVTRAVEGNLGARVHGRTVQTARAWAVRGYWGRQRLIVQNGYWNSWVGSAMNT